MAALTQDVKMYIVQQLATHKTPTQVVELVKEEYDLTVTRAQVQAYDPEKQLGKSLSKQLKDLFYETRKRFMESTALIPIANQSYRLSTLQNILNRAINRKNDVMAMDVMEQAAKEVGGFYTNKVKVGGDVDNPLTVWLQQIGGSSLPISKDVEGQVIEAQPNDSSDKKEPVKALTNAVKKKTIVERY